MNRRLAQGYQGDTHDAQRPETVAVVALGANLGDRSATIDEALRDLGRMPLTTEIRAAAPVESVAVKPDGPDAEAPAYLNTVALVTTRLAPSVLLSYLHAIEARHGRERRERWGDRTLDLDLIDFGGQALNDERLELPHPRAWQRAFVLAPWADLEPDAELLGHGPIAGLLAEASDQVSRR